MLRGMGVGRKLLAELAVQAEAVGVCKLLAVIGDSASAGSIGLHRAGVHRCGRDALRGLDLAPGATSCSWKGQDLGAGDTHFTGNNAPHEEQTLAAWLAFVGALEGLHRFICTA